MKKSLAIICLIVALLCMTSVFTSCDLLTQATDTAKKKAQDPTGVTKIELSEAVKNYDEKDVKKSEIKLKLKGTVYTQPDPPLQDTKIALQESYNIGSTLFIDRTQNEKMSFFETRAIVSDTDEAVMGMIDGILKSDFSALKLVKNGEQIAEQLRTYLTSIHHYVTGDIKVGAEMGAKDGVYNFKAHYADDIAKEEAGVWAATDLEALNTWLNNTAQIEVSNDAFSSFLMKSVFTGFNKKDTTLYGKEAADKHVDKNGKSEYDISVKTEALVASSIFDTLIELFGINDKDALMTQYTKYAATISSWFSVKADNVCAEVEGNLPKKISTKCSISLNIQMDEMRELVRGLKADGVIDQTASNTALILLNYVNLYLCGTEGQSDCIGLKLAFDFTENFLYDEKDCKLSDNSHADYFIGLDEKPENRIDLRNYVAGILDNVDKYVADYIASLSPEYAEQLEDIRAEIAEKVQQLKETSEGITVAQIKEIINEVLKNHPINSPEE